MKAVSICVCTYRRPHLAETLRSLARLDLPRNLDVEVVVIDNDDTLSAQAIAEDAANRPDLPVRYIHAPSGNISIARNAALDAANGRYLAFIDDDETASPGWLAALVAQQEATGADAVLGPVRAVYGRDAPDWMRASALHATLPVVSGGEIRTGYSGNALIDLHSGYFSSLRFDLALGKSGGEDTMYFGRAHRAGATIVYAPEAEVFETVPEERLTMGWLAQRRLRSGRTHARVLIDIHNHGRVRELVLASAKAVYCAGATLIVLPVRCRRVHAALRCLFHLGVVAGLSDMRAIPVTGRFMQVSSE